MTITMFTCARHSIRGRLCAWINVVYFLPEASSFLPAAPVPRIRDLRSSIPSREPVVAGCHAPLTRASGNGDLGGELRSRASKVLGQWRDLLSFVIHCGAPSKSFNR